MTGTLDLDGWTVLSKRRADHKYELEAEYTVQPTACQKCGVVGAPVPARHEGDLVPRQPDPRPRHAHPVGAPDPCRGPRRASKRNAPVRQLPQAIPHGGC